MSDSILTLDDLDYILGADASLLLPQPYPLQADILASPAKYKVVACGRRFGKTIMAALKSTQHLQLHQRILLSSATQDQSDIFWAYVRKWTAPLKVYKNESRRILRYGDGELRVKTGSNPDVMKGDHYDFVVLDEAALLDPRLWYEAVLPMLLDTNGDAMFLSTPKRRNWFWELFVRAQGDTSGKWAAWNAPTHANPYLKPEAINALAENMTQESYQQEILAQFLEGQGAVFRGIDECATLEPRDPYAGHFVIGVDWAMSGDSTVFVVMDTDTRQMVALDRFHQVNWSLQRGRLRALYDTWKPDFILAESNSIGSPNIEALQNEGLPVRAFETTAVSKPPLIESLVLAFERREIQILNHAILKNELKAYERKVSATGRSQYSAPAGMHDDTVIALALAWQGIMTGRLNLPVVMEWGQARPQWEDEEERAAWMP